MPSRYVGKQSIIGHAAVLVVALELWTVKNDYGLTGGTARCLIPFKEHMDEIHIREIDIRATHIRVDTIIDVSMAGNPWELIRGAESSVIDLVYLLRLLGLNGKVCQFSVVDK